MKNIVWTARACLDMNAIAVAICEYAGENSAAHYMSEFNRLVELAAFNPLMGKIGLAKTRELYPINGKYRIVYEVQGDDLVVLTVKSTKQLHTPDTLT